jgi:hypothetical protein
VKCHVPVDLLQVQPRIWGDLETSQAISFFAVGLLALAALAGRLPLLVAVLLAGPCAGYALLEVDGQPIRRLAPRLWRHTLRRSPAAEHHDVTLWQDPAQDGPRHQFETIAHCLVGRPRDSR